MNLTDEQVRIGIGVTAGAGAACLLGSSLPFPLGSDVPVVIGLMRLVAFVVCGYLIGVLLVRRYVDRMAAKHVSGERDYCHLGGASEERTRTLEQLPQHMRFDSEVGDFVPTERDNA